MKFLIDNALSPLIAVRLRQAGHEAVHALDCGLADAADQTILERAAREDRVLISADTDFSTLLTLKRETKPSLILFRGEIDARPERQATMLLANLPSIVTALQQGCVAVLEYGRARVRLLPIIGGP